MIAVFVMATAFAAAQTDSKPGADTGGFPFPSTAPARSLTIPDPIGPAIVPYLYCLYDSRGVEHQGMDGTRPAPTVPLGGDCSARRREAAERADRILRNRSIGTTAQRAEYIEQVLLRVERYAAGATPHIVAATPDDPSKPADPLPSIDIPYQIIPAFQVYTGCVGEHFMTDPRHNSPDAAAVRQANSDAVAACREVRETQLARAFQLLTDYRLYAGNREAARQAARTAFDRFDHEYLIESDTPASSDASN